ncbi:MAG: phosphatase PAP2 family protein [Mariprofundaceae bacterium]|nr:phosphatase PAP2 family protein [Mariprofundaceae bacterium]
MLELMDWNITLFHLMNGANTVFLDTIMGVVSGLGDGLIVALCCAIVCMYRLRLGVAATLAFLVSGVLAQLIKRTWDMPRPPALLEHVHILGSALQSHSFPSGHATSDGVMVLLAFLLWSCADWRAYAVAALFLLAAIGRIYGGVHFPLDVGVGLMIGMLTMYVCERWSTSWQVSHWQQSAWWWRIVGMIVVIEAAVLGLGYHMQPTTAQSLSLVFPILALFLVAKFWKQVVHDVH